MDHFYRALPDILQVVQTPDFEVVRNGKGIVELESVDPTIQPSVNGQFSLICRVKDSSSGRVYVPRFGAQLRAQAYITEAPLRSSTYGHDYREPLSEDEKATATAVLCSVAYKPTDSACARAGIYVELEFTFVWPRRAFIYIEFEWVAGPWTVQLDSRAHYQTHPVGPYEHKPFFANPQLHQMIAAELAPYWLSTDPSTFLYPGPTPTEREARGEFWR